MLMWFCLRRCSPRPRLEMRTRMYMLGVMYAKGMGVIEDDKEAVKWYRKAAELGTYGCDGPASASCTPKAKA